MEERRWKEEQIETILQESAEELEIPKGLEPEEMRKHLSAQGEKSKSKGGDTSRGIPLWVSGHVTRHSGWYKAVAAFCLLFVIFAAGDKLFPTADVPSSREKVKEETRTGTTYEQLYQSFSRVWDREEQSMNREWRLYSESAYDTVENGIESSESISMKNAGSASGEKESKDYGRTNVQEEEVEEADIVKNDGRYLYQVVNSTEDGREQVQIADTENGLKTAAKVGDFGGIEDIYVWKDKLVILEPGWARQETQWEESDEDVFIPQPRVDDTVSYADIGYEGNSFLKVHIYDIENREKPKKYHTFTIKGSYEDSRISEGYLYLFVQNRAVKPQKPEEYEAYIPMLEGKPMEAENIILPKDSEVDSYLIMASINMEEPKKFKDTKAIVTSADQFYVSTENIYVTDARYGDTLEEGEQYDSTQIYRFSYKKGKMKKEAEGTVKGTLTDDLALNEQNGYLRMVTTVDHQRIAQVTDDISGEDIGYETIESGTSNSLYILDENLKITGRIENLAKNEQIYSARFLGDMGYFVTFRQTDPLFSADLSDPKHPKILGELKISGFSEYLHFYDENLLLGIGMEADEEDGSTQGMKLSMFNIEDPADVKEESKKNLSKYDSAQALYDYKAVLIDTEKNLFGFLAEGYAEEMIEEYLLFTYEDGEFRQMMKLDCSDYKKYAGNIRGTYIGERFYLLCQNGRIEEYSLETGELTGELEL